MGPCSSQFHAQTGTLLRELERRPGAVEWLVRLGDGTEAPAIAMTALGGELAPGQRVWLNTTAAELSLGTGGLHFVLAPLDDLDPLHPTSSTRGEAPRRERGHLMKLRYTPLQHAVMAVEEPASPHQAAMEAAPDLRALPVIAAELHSSAMAAAAAARACGAQRVVYVMSDGAALPLPVSRLAARLRSHGVLAGTITAGQAFGGDLEAVTVASALIAARAVLDADVVIVAQGPGNAGTGTTHGFSGLAQAEHLHAAASLEAHAVAALRISFADPRPRHRGLSHHSATVLGRMTLARVRVAIPHLPKKESEELRHAVLTAGLPDRHDLRQVQADDLLSALMPHQEFLTTMGRTIDEDRAFFLAACAAARLALHPEAGTPWP